MVKFVKYDNLDIRGKLQCIDEFINVMMPYEDFEDCSITDIEEDIRIWDSVKDGYGYRINEDGDWYEIDNNNATMLAYWR